MRITRFVMLAVATFIFSTISAQPWMNDLKKSDENTSFYEIQKSFNDHWAKRNYEKGKGFKQFKRWEYFMEPRVNSEGYLAPNALLKAWQKAEKNNINNAKSESANWVHLGPDDTPTNINLPSWKRGSGRVNCIGFHPTNSNIMYVGAPSGGLWKTIDGGQSWVTTTDNLPSIGVSDIAIHPNNPDIIYLATGDGDARDTYSVGILKSTDAGATWDIVSLGLDVVDNYTIRRIKIDPENPSTIIAATNYGIIRSTDNGNSWEVRASGHFKDIEFNPENTNITYATTYDYSGGAKIYLSTDNGYSWTSTQTISDANRIELAVTPADPDRVYALASNAEDNGYLAMYRSNDSGSNWYVVHSYSTTYVNLLGWSTQGDDEGGQGWYDLACAADPNDADIVYTGGVNTWKSSNGGTSWEIASHWYGGDGTPYVHADHHTLDFNPLTGTLFSGNDGGLHKTSNGGSSWSDISDGLQILQIYKMGLSTTNSNRFVIGAQDNGSMRYNDGTWTSILGGDGMDCLIDYEDDDIIYAEYYYGNISRSMDGGYSFTEIKPAASGDGAWVTPYIIDPDSPSTLYIGFDEVYKSTNRGNSWTTISSNLTGGTNLRTLAIAPSNSDVIFAATLDEIHKTTDGGANWTNISSGLPSNSITGISINPNDPDMIWVSLSGYDDGEKIYSSTNGGASWSNYSEGLPNIPANCVVYENNTNHALYLGTDLGVYYRNAGMLEWAAFNNGLPNVIVNDIEIQYSNNKLRAATYGRGVWESDLFELVAAPVADFSWNVTNACEGIVEFASTSSGTPNTYTWTLEEGITSNEVSPEHIYANLGSFSVTLVVSNNLGTDTITKEIEISAEDLNVDFTADVTVSCQASEIQFTNLSDETIGYTWDFGDGENSQNTNPSHLYTSEGSFDVSLTSHSTLCPDITETKVDFINFNPSNTAEINMPISGYLPDQLCCDGTVYDNGGPDNTYSNSTNGKVKIRPENADQIEFTFVNFDMEAGNDEDCEFDNFTIYEGITAYSGYIIGKFCNSNPPSGNYITTGNVALLSQYTDHGVTENGFKLEWHCLMVDFSYEADETNIKIIDFTDISTNYPTGWTWDFGDGNNSTDQNPTHTYQNVGIYEVTLTVTNEQGDYTETKNVNVGNVSISDEEIKETVKVFPNPVSGNSINVQLNSVENGEIQYSLINAKGKLLDNGSINALNNSTIKIPLHNYSSGVYTLKIVQDSKIYIKLITIL